MDTIKLNETNEILNEIIVSESKRNGTSKIIRPTNSILSEFGFYKGWATEIEANYATFISNNLSFNSKITYITLELKKGHMQNENNLYMPFKVNLYSVDSISGLPKNSLIGESIFVQKTTSNHIEIDITQNYIDFPKNGIFVSVEILSADYYVRNRFYYNVGPSFKYLRKLNGGDFFTVKKALNQEEWRLIESFVYNFGIKIEY